MKPFILAFALSALSSASFAYEICGNSNDKFILTCNDGHSNTSSMPPNHNTATEFCADHGGVAAGYPRPIDNTARMNSAKPASCVGGQGGTTPNTSAGRVVKELDKSSPMMSAPAPATRATDYNSSRSNKSL